jgi:hypothetical protein
MNRENRVASLYRRKSVHAHPDALFEENDIFSEKDRLRNRTSLARTTKSSPLASQLRRISGLGFLKREMAASARSPLSNDVDDANKFQSNSSNTCSEECPEELHRWSTSPVDHQAFEFSAPDDEVALLHAELAATQRQLTHTETQFLQLKVCYNFLYI